MLLFWWNNGKLTTIFIVLAIYLTLCAEAKGDSFQVVWVAQYQIFDAPSKEIALNSGEYAIDGTRCLITRPRAVEQGYMGEYRTIECVNYGGFQVITICTLDGEIHDFMSPTASLILKGINPHTQKLDDIFVTLRCFVRHKEDKKTKTPNS
jgi:hypothetical protein